MRIATLNKDKCQSKRCNQECISYCPRVRSGDETVVMGENGKPIISEELCVGCGICVHKCPFDAIRIINLAEELEGELVQQYGVNGFRLYRLPIPRPGEVVGMLGPNAIGKTTALKILSGQEIPNLGNLDATPTWEPVLEKYAGTELYNHLEKVANGKLTFSFKPQYVDMLPRVHSGKVRQLLEKVETVKDITAVAAELDLNPCIDRDIGQLSGGELQRVAIAATVLKDADIYFFDEPSSYLDIYQRLKIAKVVQSLAEEKSVMVIEHDLAVLDFLADTVHLMYGSEGSYGVLAQPRTVRNAINTYLDGFLKEENVRIRDRPIKFEARAPRKDWAAISLVSFGQLRKDFAKFTLTTEPGAIKAGEVVGIVGPNATGKTTFVKILADEIKPDAGEIDANVKVSYKPQYIEPSFGGTVNELFMTELGNRMTTGFFKSEISTPLNMAPLQNRELKSLSGGELQRVAIALALGREADIYLIDEPSAYLDSNQRMEAARTIRRVMEKSGRSGMIVDHDVYFIDMVSDSIMVFSGEPSVSGKGEGPLGMREGMNLFLRNVDITFRRDNDTNRPRINKKDSRLDREQKSSGEFYYTE
ncbi:MAG: ribosome biogenesis/translation initiation ATPase RLI [Euryarchaeota archaeon]|nr:ribosome biogenesis/translation initiation ATPase RLI [Euryarchaeota archaeon]MBU4032974.1 ribosome biogenesis/translation initiation ATPase RLI [Candidatus Thermoplasmatota archaeon]MBU4070551.1 ribosome biogenesis/translation initiation ATPase RLI [Candidatus Thermoplasmatota archaeon]MBU4145109.1 ribosome biogenesis/translation initiation ATPase RLI [Candidatus Thermoplasmatota archaeon]